jgi:hypothetical protein
MSDNKGSAEGTVAGCRGTLTGQGAGDGNGLLRGAAELLRGKIFKRGESPLEALGRAPCSSDGLTLWGKAVTTTKGLPVTLYVT